MNFPTPKLISFRDEVTSVENTTYLTHSLYYHPAKFIPQIVRFCLDNYYNGNGAVLDPFAGSGTLGVETAINGYKTYLLDINPLLNYFYPIKIPKFSIADWEKHVSDSKIVITDLLNKQNKSSIEINNHLNYWYPEQLYSFFNNLWNNFYKQEKNNDEIVNKIVTLVLFKLSKQYSYAEHSMPKLFSSKRKRKQINELLEDNNILFEKINKSVKTYLLNIDKSVKQLLNINLNSNLEYFSGVDAYSFDYSKLSELSCIITSPPYLQAQEYIRTFKLEMMWAKISNEEIKQFSNKEIPFRKTEGIIHGRYLDSVRNKIKRKDLLNLFDSYFWYTIKTLENASKRLVKGGKLCVLIGNPKMSGVEVEIWKAIYEYFLNELNFKSVAVFEDRIKTRKLFKGRNNQNPDGMKSEYLIVLEKN